ncbi:MAG: hypothetical protein RLZZ165_768 [Bacteroidota bacterium]|jgi:hypothetical protein
MKVFYFVSLVCNWTLITSLMRLLLDIIGYLCFSYDSNSWGMIFFHADSELIVLFHLFLFACTPLAILWFKNYRYHGLLFSLLILLAASSYFWYQIDRLAMEILGLEVAMFVASGLLLSCIVSLSQRVLGERLLPARYCRMHGTERKAFWKHSF